MRFRGDNFQTGADRPCPILHNVEAEAGAVMLVVTDANTVVGNAKLDLAGSGTHSHNYFVRAPVFVRINYGFPDNSIKIGGVVRVRNLDIVVEIKAIGQ